jgi:hypothetical protein
MECAFPRDMHTAVCGPNAARCKINVACICVNTQLVTRHCQYPDCCLTHDVLC